MAYKYQSKPWAAWHGEAKRQSDAVFVQKFGRLAFWFYLLGMLVFSTYLVVTM